METTPRKPPAFPPTTPISPPESSPRRSLRQQKPSATPGSASKNPRRSLLAPVTPSPANRAKRRRSSDGAYRKQPRASKRRRLYYNKVVYDGGEFEVGDDVYVKRKDGPESDDEDPEIEECRVCFRAGRAVMVECDDCLGGFHLKCLKPPLRKVPEGAWLCSNCNAKKNGIEMETPNLPDGKRIRRTAKEKLLSSDLWAARIESLWREPDGTYMLRCCWYIIPEETAAGRQQHNLRRELYRTNDFGVIEMECVLRHCYIMNPKEFSEASNEGDDVFYCEYEYDVHWHSFKCLVDIDDAEEHGGAEKDDAFKLGKDSGFSTGEESEEEDDSRIDSPNLISRTHELAANSYKGRVYGLQRIRMKRIPERTRSHKQSELERAKATLMLARLPKSLPCRNKEMEEITAFIKGAMCDDQCLGRCLYIHGVPGTGKTMSVLAVMRNLKSEVDAGSLRPYTFVEINGLKLASPENIYKVIYEAISGHRVGWKKALYNLNERFSEGRRAETQPCILLIDELDLLLTRSQSVLYNVLDWPTRPYSKLIVIGIANTMDLPEKLLPRISSRMGIQRLCFGPYTYKQLQEIISSRLNGIEAFEGQAIEFASRKVAAMSGDARRALEICRFATEVADYRLKHLVPPMTTCISTDSSSARHLVNICDIETAIQEVFQAPHIRIMKSSSRLSKILLVAMVHELYRSGLGEIAFEQLANKVSSMCSSNREEFPGWDTLLRVGCKLGECRIILCEEGAKHSLQKLQLNFPSDDVAFALKDCPEIPWLEKYLTF